jgi:hypothetical protein
LQPYSRPAPIAPQLADGHGRRPGKFPFVQFRAEKIMPVPPSRPVSALFAQSYRFGQTCDGNPIKGLANRVQGRRVMGHRQISPQPPHRGKASPRDSPHAGPSRAAAMRADRARRGIPARTEAAPPGPRGPPILPGDPIFPRIRADGCLHRPWSRHTPTDTSRMKGSHVRSRQFITTHAGPEAALRRRWPEHPRNAP